MIPFEVCVAVPPPGGSMSDEVRESLRHLETELRLSGRDKRHVVSVTLFVNAPDPTVYHVHRDHLHSVVREAFEGHPPATSIVAQAPEGPARVVLEAAVLASPVDGAVVARRAYKGIPYTVVTGRGLRQVHCGGVGSGPALNNFEDQATDAFSKMEAVLHREGMTFGHVVRQWGYIEGMLDIRADCPKGHQGYQAFNDVRAIAYGRSQFPAGYPAATGIGQAAGGVVLDFLAFDAPAEVSVAPLSNPRQTDAHRYSPDMLVGESLDQLPDKSTPKFERAKLVARGDERAFFVSGTASIVGEKSVAIGDVAAQTRTTIDNIAALIEDRRLSRLRAYVKRQSDLPIVRRICEEAFGGIPAVYVEADVCRDELLVELEGALVLGAGSPRPLAHVESERELR